MSGPPLAARDYKRPRRAAWPIVGERLRDFALGLGVGLAIAVLVFISDHRVRATGNDPGHPVPAASTPDDVGLAPEAGAVHAATARHPSSASAGASTAASAEVGKYDFYQMLPHVQVVVPGREHGSRPPASAQVVRPGTYFLQVGSYRDAAIAERVRAQVARLGISAAVQRIAVDNDVWHRVRVGPIRDLAQLNRLRHQLQDGDLDALVIRVDD